MLAARVLCRTRCLAISDVVCDGAPAKSLDEECASSFEVVLPRRGVFVCHSAHGDTVSASTPVSTADDLRLRRLFAALGQGAFSPLEAEEAALELVRGLARETRRRASRRPFTARRETAARRRRLVEAARELVAVRFREKLSLEEISEALGTSAFHLCRVFQSATGQTLHRYQVQLRLREALEVGVAPRNEQDPPSAPEAPGITFPVMSTRAKVPPKVPPKVLVRQLVPERWPDFVKLFGPRGACGGCWCMTPRLPRAEYERGKGDVNKRKMLKLVEEGPPPGLLAYAGGEPVGWCAIAPRERFRRLESSRILAPVDDRPVWSIGCFFVAKEHRNRGVTVRLLEAAARYAKRGGARIVEGYPVEPRKNPMPVVFAYTGIASAFRRVGFTEVARRSAGRPIFRLEVAPE